MRLSTMSQLTISASKGVGNMLTVTSLTGKRTGHAHLLASNFSLKALPLQLLSGREPALVFNWRSLVMMEWWLAKRCWSATHGISHGNSIMLKSTPSIFPTMVNLMPSPFWSSSRRLVKPLRLPQESQRNISPPQFSDSMAWRIWQMLELWIRPSCQSVRFNSLVTVIPLLSVSKVLQIWMLSRLVHKAGS